MIAIVIVYIHVFAVIAAMKEGDQLDQRGRLGQEASAVQRDQLDQEASAGQQGRQGQKVTKVSAVQRGQLDQEVSAVQRGQPDQPVLTFMHNFHLKNTSTLIRGFVSTKDFLDCSQCNQ